MTHFTLSFQNQWDRWNRFVTNQTNQIIQHSVPLFPGKETASFAKEHLTELQLATYTLGTSILLQVFLGTSLVPYPLNIACSALSILPLIPSCYKALTSHGDKMDQVTSYNKGFTISLPAIFLGYQAKRLYSSLSAGPLSYLEISAHLWIASVAVLTTLFARTLFLQGQKRKEVEELKNARLLEEDKQITLRQIDELDAIRENIFRFILTYPELKATFNKFYLKDPMRQFSEVPNPNFDEKDNRDVLKRVKKSNLRLIRSFVECNPELRDIFKACLIKFQNSPNKSLPFTGATTSPKKIDYDYTDLFLDGIQQQLRDKRP